MGKKEPRFAKYVDWALMTLASAIASLGVHLISDVSKNIQELNQKMAILITTTTNQDRRLNRLESVVFRMKR